MTLSKCPVCRAPEPSHFICIDERNYYVCKVCEARFLDPAQLPGRDTERAQYELHENDPHDADEVRWLGCATMPDTERNSPLNSGCQNHRQHEEPAQRRSLQLHLCKN